MKTKFEQNQKDMMLENVRVICMGYNVGLFSTEKQKLLTILSPYNVVLKIKRWCVKNSYRCEQIQNEKILF